MSLIRNAASALSLSVCLLAVTGAPAHAQSGTAPSIAVCDDGTQDRQACRREFGAARQQAPQDPNNSFIDNALRRCGVHKDAGARQACEDRVRGQNSQTQGSVLGGGVLRDHRISRTVPASQAPQAPAQ